MASFHPTPLMLCSILITYIHFCWVRACESMAFPSYNGQIIFIYICRLLVVGITLWITIKLVFCPYSICLKLLEVNAEGKLRLLSTGRSFIFTIVSTVCGYFLLWCFRLACQNQILIETTILLLLCIWKASLFILFIFLPCIWKVFSFAF